MHVQQCYNAPWFVHACNISLINAYRNTFGMVVKPQDYLTCHLLLNYLNYDTKLWVRCVLPKACNMYQYTTNKDCKFKRQCQFRHYYYNLGGHISDNLLKEDNLWREGKGCGPKVSSVQRFDCTYTHIQVTTSLRSGPLPEIALKETTTLVELQLRLKCYEGIFNSIALW